MQHEAKLYTLSLREQRTYVLTALFVLGNIALPQLCHLAPYGGQMFLPIFFFTLIGAYKYGFTVGLATAVLSPIANSLLFGRPAGAMLPPMLLQSVLLAVVSAALARRMADRVTPAALACVAAGCLLAGLLIERAMISVDHSVLTSLVRAVPGLLLQTFGGYYLIRKL